jgi:hypothetical protein
VSRSSQSNGCTKFSAEQNHARWPRANPSLILSLLRSLSCAAASDSERRWRERARGTALSPSPVCALTVGWTRHRRVASATLLRVRSPQRGGERRLRRGLVTDANPQEERRQDLGPDHTPSSGGRVLLAQPVDPQPVDLRPTVTARDPTGKSYSTLCSSSSPAPDLRPSPALVPYVG